MMEKRYTDRKQVEKFLHTHPNMFGAFTKEGNLAYSMSLLVDRNLASYLDTGTISGLTYAGTMGNIASTMIVSSILTAIFPTISKFAARREKEHLENTILEYSK